MYRSPFRAISRQTTEFKKKGSWKLGYHTGIDRVCDTDRILVACTDGTVTRVNSCGTSYGNHVVFLTDDGRSVLYAHMADKPAVKVGERIKIGQILGRMGNTGNRYGGTSAYRGTKLKNVGLRQESDKSQQRYKLGEIQRQRR